MKKKQILITSTVIFALLISLLITYFIVQHKILYHFAVVDNGKFYRSGTLSESGLKWAHNKTNFKTIINLRSEKENRGEWHRKEMEFANKNGVKLVDLPMETDCPPSSEQVKTFIDIVSNADNLPAIVHCYQGVTRTAMMVAIYEIAIKNKNNRSVLKNMPLFGHSFDSEEKKPVKNFILKFHLDLIADNRSKQASL